MIVHCFGLVFGSEGLRTQIANNGLDMKFRIGLFVLSFSLHQVDLLVGTNQLRLSSPESPPDPSFSDSNKDMRVLSIDYCLQFRVTLFYFLKKIISEIRDRSPGAKTSS